MARNRTIKPKFFDDVKIGRISRDARLLYIGLWVFADDMGVVPGDSVWLKSRVFPYDQIQVQQFEKWMNELVINGFICLLSYKGERFIYLPTFTRHQVVNRPNYEDLNIPKDLLDKEKDRIHGAITEQSLNNHGTFTDASCTVLDREKEALDGFPLQPSSLISEKEIKEIKENTPYGVLKKNEKSGLEILEIPSPPGSAPPPSPKSSVFIKPTIEEVKTYFEEKGLKSDPEHFYDHFESNGWKVSGRSTMKDWKAAARNWERNDSRFKKRDYAGNTKPVYGNKAPEEFGKGYWSDDI